ncbi:MAG: hypothetical protein BA066_07625 [Candidatus Korarchaeota archaeon NZ13-K]|nr:MAG: hypothetical protein BA066_07625 [Candidatus Korarchaeota archaeon NZ13-K]
MASATPENGKGGYRMTVLSEPIGALRQKENELKRRIAELKESRRALIEELRELRARRSSLIEKVRRDRETFRAMVERKRTLQDELAKVREERKESLERFREIREQVLKLKEEYKYLVSSVGMSERVLRRRIARLERRIETSPLNRDQERDLVMQISQYEAMLQNLNKAKALKRKILELMTEMERWRFFVRDSGERIGRIKEELNKLYDEITKKKEELESANKEIDLLTQQIKERSEKVDKIDEEMDRLRTDMMGVQEEIRKRFEATLESGKEVERKLKEKLAEEALEKYRNGEKLSIDELKLLMEMGLLERSV